MPQNRNVRTQIARITMLIASLGAWFSPCRADLYILVNPGSFPTIETAAQSESAVNWQDDDFSDDRACTESFAAAELARFLPLCTSFQSQEIHLQNVDSIPSRGDIILIGSAASNPLIAKLKNPLRDQLQNEQSYCLWTTKLGNQTLTLIEGKDRQGALYGAYDYLNRLGIRFYGLGDPADPNAGQTIQLPYYIQKKGPDSAKEYFTLSESYTVPTQGMVAPAVPSDLPKQLQVLENPDFLTRGFWVFEARGHRDFFLWMARNRMNYWTALETDVPFLKKLGMKLSRGWHVIQNDFLSPRAPYPYNHPKFTADETNPPDPYPVSELYQGDANSDGVLSYFEAHPEWYSLQDGKRSDRIGPEFGDNFCTSNPDATTELAKNLVRSLIDGDYRHADLVDFWMLDVGKWCQCQNCQNQGNCSDRLFSVLDQVLRTIRLARQEGNLKRPVQLVSLAYLETLAPPTKPLPKDFDYENLIMTFYPIERCYAHPLADSHCQEINRHLVNKFLGWTQGKNRTYQGQIFIGEYYNVSSLKALPNLFTNIMASDVPWYYQTGARHFHYMHCPTRLWGTWTLNQYLLSRLLWNTHTDVPQLLDQYFREVYPTTHESTRRFYNSLEQASANVKMWKHMVGADPAGITPGTLDKLYSLRSRLTKPHEEIFPLDHLHYEEFHPKQNDAADIVEIRDLWQQAGTELDASLLACKNPLERVRLLEDEKRFSYGQLMFTFYYRLIRTAMLDRRNEPTLAAREFQKAAQAADRLRQIQDLVHVCSSHANSPDALDAAQALDAFDYFRQKYGN